MYIDPFWLGAVLGALAAFAFLTIIGNITAKNKEEKHG